MGIPSSTRRIPSPVYVKRCPDLVTRQSSRRLRSHWTLSLGTDTRLLRQVGPPRIEPLVDRRPGSCRRLTLFLIGFMSTRV